MAAQAQASIVPIMEGRLDQFDLAEILQVVSIGRQYTGIELLSQDHMRAGTIYIKSGKVLHVKSSTLTGKDAFVRLFRMRPTFFNVFRVETPVMASEPLGSVRSLLLEVWQDVEAAIEAAPASGEPQEKTVVGPRPRLDGQPRSLAAPPPPSVSPPPLLASDAKAPSSRVPPARASLPPPPPAAGRAAVARFVEPRSRSGVHPAVTPPVAPQPPFVIAVASPKGGCGKTTVALNLALSLARQDQRVILVDADVNGDLLSAIDERASVTSGVFDVLVGNASVDDVLRSTVLGQLRIVPAIGPTIPQPEVTFTDQSAEWQDLLTELASRADIVVVDTPAGMFGLTHQILASCTHVIGVQQAEVIATRSFPMFMEGLRALPEARRPQVLGVFLNMLQASEAASVDVLQQLCQRLPQKWLFETSMPRNSAFLDATAAGVPVRMLNDRHPPGVSWLFDTLATEVMERLGVRWSERNARRRLLA